MRKTDTLDQFKSKKAGIAILVSLHLIGALGFMSPLSEWFVFLTPVNLIITAGMIWIDSKTGNKLGWPIAIAIILLGYGVEILGVQTGLIFGNYNYGDALGWKFFEVPPLIGVNWLIVIWGSYSLVYTIKIPKYLRWLGVGILATILDFLIEPVAMNFGWWDWVNGVAPTINYVTWFLVASIMALLFEGYPLVQKPRLGLTAIVCQFLFFGVLAWYLR